MIFNYLLRHRPAAYFLNPASGMLGKISDTIGKNSRRTLMRINLTIILLFFILALVTATGFAQNLTISKDNASIKSIFKDIKKQTGLAIIYQTQHISSFTPISLQVRIILRAISPRLAMSIFLNIDLFFRMCRCANVKMCEWEYCQFAHLHIYSFAHLHRFY